MQRSRSDDRVQGRPQQKGGGTADKLMYSPAARAALKRTDFKVTRNAQHLLAVVTSSYNGPRCPSVCLFCLSHANISKTKRDRRMVTRKLE